MIINKLIKHILTAWFSGNAFVSVNIVQLFYVEPG